MPPQQNAPKWLPTGHTCLYFPRGDTRRSGRAAIVTRGDKTGLLELTVFIPNGRSLEVIGGVRHKDDPWLKKRPEHALRNGVWDFLEPPDMSLVSKPPAMSSDEANAKLLELHKQFGDNKSREIADEMTRITGEAWNYQRVNATLRSLLRPQPED